MTARTAHPTPPPAATPTRTLPLPVFPPDFLTAARAAASDAALHLAIENSAVKKDSGRRQTLADLPNPDALRHLAGQIKAHTLDHLDYYLHQLETNILRHGGQVHFAATAADANALIVDIARRAGATRAVKAKSMATEETRLNDALAAAGIDILETDLGEFIVQLAHDRPSHLVMPVIHKNAAQIGRLFADHFRVPFTDDPQKLAELARIHLRERFRIADLGISGVNFAVAETGAIVLCSNEGNSRMCTSRPRVHVALMGMEKVIPRLDHLPVFLKLLARSASGQPLTVYTGLITGPRRPDEHDGPDEFHLVILDNGRSRILSSPYRDTLRCIRCGACLNACPIYRTIGGHAYGSVYPGPIGALLTPLFNGLAAHRHLPQATTLCGACFAACPVEINLPELLIRMHKDQVQTRIVLWPRRLLFALWTHTLASPARYRLGQRLASFLLRHWPGQTGWIRRLPGPAKGWTAQRDFPVPPPQTFRDLWKKRSRP